MRAKLLAEAEKQAKPRPTDAWLEAKLNDLQKVQLPTPPARPTPDPTLSKHDASHSHAPSPRASNSFVDCAGSNRPLVGYPPAR